MAVTWQHFVPGVPKPQGSKSLGKKRNGGAFMREDNAGTKPWRATVKRALQDERGRPLYKFEGPVRVELRFVFARPKSHPPTSQPTSRRLGDVDKLARNMLDALTQAGVIKDDAYVLGLGSEKIYGPNPGVHIAVRSAAVNPFADVSSFDQVPGTVLIPREAVESWHPSAEALSAQAIKDAEDAEYRRRLIFGEAAQLVDLGAMEPNPFYRPVGGPCACSDCNKGPGAR